MDWLEKLLGRNKQISEGLSIDRNRTSTSLNEKLEVLVPAGKIATLNAGEMVGLIAGDVAPEYTGAYESSAINCRINLDLESIKKEEAGYVPLPVYYDFGEQKDKVLADNFKRINGEIAQLVKKHQPPKVDTPKATIKDQNKLK